MRILSPLDLPRLLEAIINAVAHRDYRTRGRCVEVWLFDDRLEVMSPGGLPTAVTLEALRSRRRIHVARNPMITRVLRDLGLMLGRGEGIPRMFSEMERSWLRPPEMAADECTFTLTLRNRQVFGLAPRHAALRSVSARELHRLSALQSELNQAGARWE